MSRSPSTLKRIDILSHVRRIESTIARRFDGAARKLTQSGAREPLEIMHAVLNAVDREIQSTGRGRRVFPFNSIHVSVLAQSREIRNRFETVLAGESGLQQRIDDKLRSAGCRDAVAVSISYVGRAQQNWHEPEFHVRFARVESPAQAADDASAARARIDVTVFRGTAQKRVYSFEADRVDLGRCVEVRDSGGRLIRTNDVAFVEGSGEINQSVSRQHAHIGYQSRSREYRLYDDGSAHGTQIVRQGRTISVPRGSRGVRLNAGDEIALGDARLRIRLTM